MPHWTVEAPQVLLVALANCQLLKR